MLSPLKELVPDYIYVLFSTGTESKSSEYYPNSHSMTIFIDNTAFIIGIISEHFINAIHTPIVEK